MRAVYETCDDPRVIVSDGAVFLDLDGTLTDPKPGITESIRYALTRLGRTAPSADELVWAIGPPLPIRQARPARDHLATQQRGARNTPRDDGGGDE